MTGHAGVDHTGGVPSDEQALDISVVVLAGGSSTRFGSDKLAAPMRGSSVLDHLLDRLPKGWDIVVVGPHRATDRLVRWTREEPAGGGPLAGVAAGAAQVNTPLLAVVAGDMPHAAVALARLAAALRGQGGDVAGAVAVDETGSTNPLLAVYRTASLVAGLPERPHDMAAKRLLDLPHVEVTVTGPAGRDVDTTGDLAELDHSG